MNKAPKVILELVFSDLFVGKRPEDCWYKPTPDSLCCTPVPELHHQEVSRLRDHLERDQREEFTIEWPVEHQGPAPDQQKVERMRVRRVSLLGQGNSVFVCRRFSVRPGPLATLGVPVPVAQQMLHASGEPGLYVFMGKTGAGKTTTAASFVLERTALYGGSTWTIESPAELQIQGAVGRGRCYQTEVSHDSFVGAAIRGLMRASPNCIFIGELRTREAVRAAISAGNSGHLVVTTFHAGDLASGLSRLSSLAGEDETRNTLSDAFQFGIHLSLYNAEPQAVPAKALIAPESRGTGTPPRILSVEPLWRSKKNDAALGEIIRKGSFHMLSSEIEQQRRLLMNRPGLC